MGGAEEDHFYLNGAMDAGLVVHELGHTFGLPHAQRWIAREDTTIGPGLELNYGNPFDPMGHGSDKSDFQVASKVALGWLQPTDVTAAAESGRFTLTALSQNSGVRALRVPLSGERNLWLEYRPQRPATAETQGVVLAGWGGRAKSVPLVDFTGATPSPDVGLHVGQTFSHEVEQLHVSVLQAGPASAEVEVVWGPATPEPPAATIITSATAVALGKPVTFEARLSGAEADTSAISWWQGSQYLGSGALLTRSWSTAQEAVVHCVVSDRRGGVSFGNALVTVGSPPSRRVAGTVTNLNGNALAGARIELLEAGEPVAAGYSDDAGKFVIANLTPGTYQVRARKGRELFRASPANVTVPVSEGSQRIAVQQSARHYGRGGRADTYRPQIVLDRPPVVGSSVRLAVFDTPGTGPSSGLLVIGSAKVASTGPGQQLVTFDQSFWGDGYVDLPVPNDPSLAGQPVYFQYTVYSPSSPNGWAWTDAIEARIAAP